MVMTDEQRYNAVLKELGEVLTKKNTEISCQKWQIDQLKEKLAAAEEERAEPKQVFVEEGTHFARVLDAIVKLRTINKALRKCVDTKNQTIIDYDGLIELQLDIQSVLQGLEIGGAA